MLDGWLCTCSEEQELGVGVFQLGLEFDEVVGVGDSCLGEVGVGKRLGAQWLAKEACAISELWIWSGAWLVRELLLDEL